MEQPSYGLRIFSQAFLMEWTGLFIVMNDMGNSGCLAISALCHVLNALIRTCRIEISRTGSPLFFWPARRWMTIANANI